MATTSPDNLWSPDPTGNYNLVADLATMQTSAQTALVKRANMYVGTSTQRTAFTTAPEGVHWQDTNGSKLEYVRKSGAWVEAVPKQLIAVGGISVAQNTTGRTAISFPVGLFSTPPTVLLTLRSFKANGVAAITSDPVTTSGAYINTFNIATGANNPGIAVDWVACGV